MDCQLHQEPIDKLCLRKGCGFSCLLCFECGVEQTEHIRKHRKDIISVRQWKDWLAKAIQQKKNSQKHNIPIVMDKLINNKYSNFGNYQKMLDGLTHQLVKDVEEIKTKMAQELKQVQQKVAEILNKQKECYEKDYDELEELAGRVFDVRISSEEIKDEDNVRQIVEILDPNHQYYDDNNMMEKYYKVWYKTMNPLEVKGDWTQDLMEKMKKEVTKLEDKFMNALRVKRIEGDNIYETDSYQEKLRLKQLSQSVVRLIETQLEQQDQKQNQRAEIRLEGDITTNHDQQVNCVLATSQYLVTGSNDQKVKVFDKQTYDLVKEFNQQDKVMSLLEINEKQILSGAGNATGHIMLWDIEKGEKVQEYRGHAAQITQMDQINQQFFVSGSYDNKAILWFINQSDSCLTINKHKAMVSGVVYQPSRNVLFVSSLDRTISVWKLGFDSDQKIDSLKLLRILDEKQPIQNMLIDGESLVYSMGGFINWLELDSYNIDCQVESDHFGDIVLIKKQTILQVSSNSLVCWKEGQKLGYLKDNQLKFHQTFRSYPQLVSTVNGQNGELKIYLVQNGQLNVREYSIQLL